MLNKKLLFMAVIIVMGMGCRSVTTIAETDRLIDEAESLLDKASSLFFDKPLSAES